MDETQELPPEMTSAPSEPAGGRSFRPFMWMFLALLLLYPLSIGPAFRFLGTSRTLAPVFDFGYAPLGFLCDHCPPVNRFFLWYIGDLWGAR